MGLTSLPAFASGGYCSIAYDQATAKFGIAQDADNKDDAIAKAIAQCQSAGGTNCVNAGWAYNGFVALAVGDGNHWAGGGVHDNQSDAEAASVTSCATRTTNCKIVADASSFDY
jgi:hypothetical protein